MSTVMTNAHRISPAPMAGEDTTAALRLAGEDTTAALRFVSDFVLLSAAEFSGVFKKDCMDLRRRISLLAHFLEEIRDFKKTEVNCEVGSSPFSNCCFGDLTMALQGAKKLVIAANGFDESNSSSDVDTKKILFQFQCVTWKLEKALAKLPYEDFDISEEVQEQVELVRSQLRRAMDRYGGPLDSTVSRALSLPLDKEIDPFQPINTGNNDHDVSSKVEDTTEESGPVEQASDEVQLEESLSISSTTSEINVSKDFEDNKKRDSLAIPDDYRCPISLELMRDPVIVATGQTYERSSIQRWIDCGNTTCPKTQQKLQNLTLTPNYVLRSLISQWCVNHNIDQPTLLGNVMIKKSDGSFREVTGDIAAVESLVRKLSSQSIDECRAAVAKIRSLCKRITDNRILVSNAGAIPILVNLLTSDDAQIQYNAVTCILNLSIYENNKGFIMRADAVPSILEVLRGGSEEAKENAAAALFSLATADENKIIIGGFGAIPLLVNLLENGSSRGKKDAATALYRLCLYHRNKGRAVEAGIITTLLKMITDSSMVDESLTILAVLATDEQAKRAITKASALPILTSLLPTCSPGSKENTVVVLLALCRGDNTNLACLNRLGAGKLLSELAESGTDRAKRKAVALLDRLRSIH